MSSVIAIVKSIIGQVFALSPEGVRRLLIEGDRLFAGDQVMTGQEGMISLELADGSRMDLGRDSQWTAAGEAPQMATTANPELSVSELQQAITAGLDPTAELEATAAGAGGAGGGTGGAAGGGHSYVLLDATAQQLDATVGYDTQGLGFAAGGLEEQSALINDGLDAENPPLPVNAAPVANADSLAATEDTPVTFTAAQLTGNDTDTEGTPLTINSVTSGANGTAVLNANGTVTFTPNANFNGTADFTYTVTDGQLTSNTATATVTVGAVNDAPIANADNFTVNEDGSVSLTLLANDSAADGGLSIKSINGTALTGATQSINVTNGVVNVAADGSLTFVPNADFNGTINFGYVAQDADGDTASATVSITVNAVSDAPTGTNKTVTINEDGSKTLSASDFGFSDVDAGDSIGAVRIDSLPAAGSLQLNGVSVSSGQVITLADLNSGHLVFRPTADASGSNYAKLTFSVSDQAGLFDSTPNTLTVDVTPVADVPIVTIVLGSATANVVMIDTGNFSSTNLGFRVSAKALDGGAGSIAINGSPNGFGVAGDASGAPAELGQSGGFSEKIIVDFTAPVASATVSFAWLAKGEKATYTLFDKAGIEIGTRTINGQTDAIDNPITLSAAGVAISRIEFSTPSGSDNDYLIHSISFVSSKTYPLTITATPSDIDHSESISSITVAVPDGASLSAGTNNGNGTWSLPLTSNGSYSVSVNSTTHAITISGLSMTVAGNPTGSLALTVTATAQDGSDTEIGSASLSIGDTAAPETQAVVVSANEDAGPISIVLSATDAASSIANFTIDSIPANGTLSYRGQAVQVGQVIPSSSNQADLTFTPNLNWNGSSSFQYRASDTAGNVGLTPATVAITITPVNDAPVNTLAANYTTTEDVPLKLSELSVSDVDSATGSISVTLTAASGTLSAAGANGVTVNGSGSGSLVLSGTLANINAYLAAADTQPTYQPVKDASGTVTLTMTTSDGGNSGSGNVLSDSDSISINITPVADALPGSDVSLVIGAPLTNSISFATDGGLTGTNSHTFGNGVTISTAGNGTFNWSGGNDLGINSAGDNGTEAQRIEGNEAINFSFPSGMQFMALKLKNSTDDAIKVSSKLEAADLAGQSTLSGIITTSSTTTVSSANLKVELQLEVVNASGITSTVTRIATINSGGSWSASLTGISGTITKATLNTTLDGNLFNQGGNDSANVTYSISADMSSLSIGLGAANAFNTSGQSKDDKANNGFQIEYIAVDASQTGLTSYSYPVDLYAVVQDKVGTAETFTSLALSDLPAGSILSVAHADGSYQEIMPNAQGVYDLSAYTSLLSTSTTTAGTDKIYLTTSSALPSGFAPTLTLEVSDGGISTAKTIIGGSTDSTLSGGTGNDYISGGAGNDTLNGGSGNDHLIGDTGNDILLGGSGNDTLTGGSGADLFIWKAGDTGSDVLKDFNKTEGDRIDLRDLLPELTDTTMSNFLQIDTGTNSLLISSTGQLNTGGAAASHADVTIKLEGMDLSSTSINSLIAGADPTIKVDHS